MLWIVISSTVCLNTYVNSLNIAETLQGKAYTNNWLYKLFSDLCYEYQHRYHKTHLCWTKLNEHIKCPPSNLSSDLPFKSPPLAMPDACKIPESAVDSYRKYYILEKAPFCKWTNRPVPEWFLTI